MKLRQEMKRSENRKKDETNKTRRDKTNRSHIYAIMRKACKWLSNRCDIATLQSNCANGYFMGPLIWHCTMRTCTLVCKVVHKFHIHTSFLMHSNLILNAFIFHQCGSINTMESWNRVWINSDVFPALKVWNQQFKPVDEYPNPQFLHLSLEVQASTFFLS